MNLLRRQYERFPYPPIPFLALPKRDQGKELRFETHGESHRGKRILIAGCGTLEPAVVAQMHPYAREIVAVDISSRSISIAEKRLTWLRIARPFSKIGSVQFVTGDACEIALNHQSLGDLGNFDYILASNVLHHTENPALFLETLSKTLKSGGLLRMVTYPKGSRFWMRKTSAWLKSHGLSAKTPSLVREARCLIRSLSASNPIRSCFESQPETRTNAGLVDAFFNASESPLSPLEWAGACGKAGLSFISEAQAENSRSTILDSFLKNPSALSFWEKLQILDNTWELCSNPILWLRKAEVIGVQGPLRSNGDGDWVDHPFKQAELLLQRAGCSLRDYQTWLRKEVGPRVHPRHPHELLRGLSITEYDLAYLLSDDLL